MGDARKYRPGPTPVIQGGLLGYLKTEFSSISEALDELADLGLETRYAAPDKPRAGMIVLADGTVWNPGAGAGVYCYYGGAWNRLG